MAAVHLARAAVLDRVEPTYTLPCLLAAEGDLDAAGAIFEALGHAAASSRR